MIALIQDLPIRVLLFPLDDQIHSVPLASLFQPFQIGQQKNYVNLKVKKKKKYICIRTVYEEIKLTSKKGDLKKYSVPVRELVQELNLPSMYMYFIFQPTHKIHITHAIFFVSIYYGIILKLQNTLYTHYPRDVIFFIRIH